MKYCTKCDLTGLDSTYKCSQCGSVLIEITDDDFQNIEENEIDTAADPHVPNYYVLAILATLFGFVITGLISLVYAVKANTYAECREFDKALENAKQSRWWLSVSVIVLIVIVVLVFII